MLKKSKRNFLKVGMFLPLVSIALIVPISSCSNNTNQPSIPPTENNSNVQNIVNSIIDELQQKVLTEASQNLPSNVQSQVKDFLNQQFEENNFEIKNLNVIPNDENGTLTIEYEVVLNNSNVKETKTINGFKKQEPITPPVNPPLSTNGLGGNGYGHCTPNPNYASDPSNSFLASPSGPTNNDFAPSEGIEKSAELEYWNYVTDQQKENAKVSFGIQIGTMGSQGTAWILDYKIPDGINDENSDGNTYTDENYPTTWYFGTNAHVLDDLVDSVNDDSYLYPIPEKDNLGNQIEKTDVINLFCDREEKDEQKTRRFKLRFNSIDGNFPDKIMQNVDIKRIYIGNDFLSTSPSDFNNSYKYTGKEEYADFAVLEVTFKDFDFRDVFPQMTNANYGVYGKAYEIAKEITLNYANWPSNKKFKYKKKDLLNSRNELNDGFHIVGFPVDTSQSPRPCVNYPKGSQYSSNNKGQQLSTAKHYTTFDDEHIGVQDGAIGMSSWFGYTYKTEDKYYATWGLIYPNNYGSLDAGSSGSLLTDSAGYSWGIHFAGDNTAVTGLAQAFYSEGYDYHGKYGKYNLPAYDLISGEPYLTNNDNEKLFPLQKTSYRDNLLKLYANSNYRTNLFPNGIDRVVKPL